MCVCSSVSVIVCVLFCLKGNQGNQWSRGQVNIAANQANIMIMFEAIRGSSYTSDIAIDDILLRNGICNKGTGE